MLPLDDAERDGKPKSRASGRTIARAFGAMKRPEDGVAL